MGVGGEGGYGALPVHIATTRYLIALLVVITHSVNKQLADKERVAAAMENDHLLELVNQCLKTKPLP